MTRTRTQIHWAGCKLADWQLAARLSANLSAELIKRLGLLQSKEPRFE